MKKRISGYNWEDYGWEVADYFPGAGVVFTPYDAVFVGVGADCEGAVMDALEGAAQADWDLSGVEYPLLDWREPPSDEHDYVMILRVKEAR